MQKLPYIDLPKMSVKPGKVVLPGSKSISNRVLLLSALCEGETILENILQSDDTERMLEALQTLGIERYFSWKNLHVRGGGGNIPEKKADIFLGNAGTAFRPLTAVLALSDGEYILRGVPRMHERPIGDLVDGLRQLWANIEYLEKEWFPPLKITPFQDTGVSELSIAWNVSSQFLSSLLMSMPFLHRKVNILLTSELISRPYVDMTVSILKNFGIHITEESECRFSCDEWQAYHSPGRYFVESDASSASYFLALGVISGEKIEVSGVGEESIQGDIAFAYILADIGGNIILKENAIVASREKNARLRAFDIDADDFPDAAMTLAVVACFTDGECRIRNIGSWRVKETDRIEAMATELRKIWAEVTTTDDSISIIPPKVWKYADIETYDDHRMAMCFSLFSVACDIRILDPACVNKTFPEFFEVLANFS